jgi:PAS domain S-box-containing protein
MGLRSDKIAHDASNKEFLNMMEALAKIANMSKREAPPPGKARNVPPALKSMIDASPIAAVLSDPRQPDNPIAHCNEAFLDLTGYARDEVIGRNCRFLAGPTTEEHLSDEIRQGVRGKIPVLVQIRNYRKDGTPFRNALLVAPIFDSEGELDYFLGSQSAAPDPDFGPSRTDIAKSKVRQLSGRQREVLTAMSLGRLTKQIANDIGVSERTVKLHKAALLKALDVRSVAEAIRTAIESGL